MEELQFSEEILWHPFMMILLPLMSDSPGELFF